MGMRVVFKQKVWSECINGEWDWREPRTLVRLEKKLKEKNPDCFAVQEKMPGGVKYPLRLIAYEQVFLDKCSFFIVDNFNFFICKV